MWIWAFFLTLLAVCAVVLVVFLMYEARPSRCGQVVTGRVMDWHKSRIPGFGYVTVSYSVKGRPHSCRSCLLPNYRKSRLRPGSMRTYIIRKYPKTLRTAAFYVAEPVF